jgi:pyrroline-5-carboxylate reductase
MNQGERMMLEEAKLAILGCGKMGEAILGGLLDSGSLQPAAVTAVVRRPARAEELAERYGVSAVAGDASAVGGADIVLLCLKPQNARGAISDLQEELEGRLLVSICAGLSLADLAPCVPRTRLIRAMPNTPCLIREGMSVIAAGPGSTAGDLALARQIFSSVGRCLELDEKHMDAVTGLSGSGPAFACVVLEAMADGGVMMGLPREVAVELAAQTMQGAARLVLHSGLHPAALKDQVTTPAGCTIAGLLTMEDGRIRSTLARTIQEATHVASGLGGKGG